VILVAPIRNDCLVPAVLSPPVLIAPAPYEVSFGRIAGRVPRGTTRIVVRIGRRVVADKRLGRGRFDLRVDLPSRDLRLTVTALAGTRRSSASVAPVFGLPRAAEPRGPPRRAYEDARLARVIYGLARSFGGACGIYVRDLRTGAGTTWSAETPFPAASTLKVGIAIEVLRVLRGKPLPGGRLDRLMRSMLIPSDDRPANDLLVWIGGSTSAGAARVNAIFRALGMRKTDMYGGYIVQSTQPSFVGKRTTASDFARLLLELHRAANGRGQLARRYRGSFVPADARFLLYLIAHARPNWLGRFLPGVAFAHKPGWITKARHDGGVAYTPNGAFIAVVLTWNARGVGPTSELLAARVARAAYARFRQRGGRAASDRSARPRRG
jgi:Beta-lactamase enzyme family